MPLTDTSIRNAKPSTSTVKLSDGAGLQLWVTPKGAKLWCLAYRFGGKQKKLSIGLIPRSICAAPAPAERKPGNSCAQGWTLLQRSACTA